jgi:hypothetical protein
VKFALLKRCGTAAAVLQLSACSWFGFLHPSAPTVAGGSLSVAPARMFVYLPARDGRISPNRIENTAMSSIVLKEDINEAVRDAVARALRLSGFQLDNPTRALAGRIEYFSVSDIRSPAVWMLRTRYTVHDTATGRLVYASTQTVRLRRPTFTNAHDALEDTVARSIEALIRDPAFLRSVN